MGFGTAIEWANHTFNPWIGCQRVSPGCVNCYAETWDERFREGRNWGARGVRERTSHAAWAKVRMWNAQAAAMGERWRVFPSMCDPFEERDELVILRTEFLALVEATSSLDWLLLTKRPENVMGMIPEHWRAGLPRNVWIGTSVEDQQRADERIPHLLRVPAVVRFLSAEPLIGPVDLSRWVWGSAREGQYGTEIDDGPSGAIGWVIVGGESGPGARPMHPEWARVLRDQCRAAGVPFLFKQWGEWRPTEGISGFAMFPDGSECHAYPYPEGGVGFQRVGKHEAGRLLDGEEITEFPEVAG